VHGANKRSGDSGRAQRPPRAQTSRDFRARGTLALPGLVVETISAGPSSKQVDKTWRRGAWVQNQGALGRHDGPRVGDSHEILDTIGNIEKAQGVFSPAVDEPLQLRRAANPPTKLMRLPGVTQSLMPKIGSRTCFCRRGYVQLFDGAPRGGQVRPEAHRLPLAFEIKPQLVFARRPGRWR